MILLNALSIVAYVGISLYVLRRHKKHFVLFGYLFVSQAWALVSCFYNDLGTYNIELLRFTFPTLATSRLALLYIVFNAGFLAVAALLDKVPLTRVDFAVSPGSLQLGNLKASAYAAIGLVVIYIAYVFAVEGIPVLSGFGKYEFFQAADPMQRALLIYGNLIAFALGYFRGKANRISVNGIILFVFLAYAVMIGNKFSMLVSVLVHYYVAIYIRYYYQHPDLRVLRLRHALLVGAAAVVVGAFAFTTYSVVIGHTSIAYNYLLNRTLTFQGEIWWAVDNDIASKGPYDDDHGEVELTNLLHRGAVPAEEVGMKYLMIKILGPKVASTVIARGYLYTMAYPAILIAMFPFWVTAVLQFLVGAFYFLMLYYLYYSIVYHHAFRSIVAMVILMPFTTVLFTGNFEVFFTFGMIVKILILLTLEMGSFGARRGNVSA